MSAISARRLAPRAAAAAPAVAIDVASPCAAWRAALPDAAARAVAAAQAAVADAGVRLAPEAELSIVLGDDALLRELNRRWRRRDAPTNVLSFASGDEPGAGRPQVLGDVVVAYETVAREAQEQGKTLAQHLAHLVAHGVLHLLGYDHVRAAEASRMEALERRVLARIGIADPYRCREGGDG